MKQLIFTLLILFVFFACSEKDDDNISVAQESYILPGNTFFPEGIAYHEKSGTFFTGSVANGDILRVNVQNGEANIFATGSQQNRAAATGLKLDKTDRLWVCGGASNIIQVLDLNGMLLKSWDTKALFNSGFINDCIYDNTHIYFTDSQVRKIYRTSVTAAQPGDLEEWLTFTDAQIPYATGVNANGIVNTLDNKYLIIVVSSSGKLYRIDKASKAITEIILDAPVTAGDGLYLINNVLFVSRNATNQIFPVTLNAEYTQGSVGTSFGTNLLFNTTMDKAGNYFLVVNGQLNRRGTGNPVLPFTISRVAIP
ncbi:MAG: SMP-30/gluconolactonase/LRE family protein [Adhaeribacter sp.]